MTMSELAQCIIESRHGNPDCKELAKHYLALYDVFKDRAYQMRKGKDYLMTTENITVEDCLDAFGFRRDGLK